MGVCLRHLACVGSLCVFRGWRTSIAHSLKHADPISNVPLAVRVCTNDAGVDYTAQAGAHAAHPPSHYLPPPQPQQPPSPSRMPLCSADMFQKIVKYEKKMLGIPQGILLSSLCCVLWWLVAINDIWAAVRVSIAVICLRGAQTRVVDGKIVSLSTCRILSTSCACSWSGSPSLVCCIPNSHVLNMLRVPSMLPGILAYAGSLFVGQASIKLSDMILNAVALEVCCMHARQSVSTCAEATAVAVTAVAVAYHMLFVFRCALFICRLLPFAI